MIIVIYEALIMSQALCWEFHILHIMQSLREACKVDSIFTSLQRTKCSGMVSNSCKGTEPRVECGHTDTTALYASHSMVYFSFFYLILLFYVRHCTVHHWFLM